MQPYRVLLVDDEASNLESLERILRTDGAEVFSYQDPRKAIDHLHQNAVDVLITDFRMQNMSGIELLEACKLIDPTTEIILITAFGTVEIAVEAMKKGAYDFITKPLQRVPVLRAIHRALEKRKLVHENSSLKEELKTHLEGAGRELIGKSEAMRRMMELAQQAARSRANVLIEGESGTGKGVLAEYLHRTGDLSSGLFVKINCTAIPDTLLEAELFGYEAGAFTGAMKRKKGRVELAEQGTLFLDEVGIAPPTFQAKLLRFLQEGEFERLGGMETLHVKARVISATNTDLKTAIRENRFREDLYYRLNVVHIQVPPLRERTDDIPLLAKIFLEESARKNGREVPLLEHSALDVLAGYSWPGNIRELQNLMERIVVLNNTGIITVNDIPKEVSGSTARPRSVSIPVGLPLREAEKRIMDETLRATRGDKKLAAKLLGVHPRTIHRHLDVSDEVVVESPIDRPIEDGAV
jgi:two-component system, NtrC family, response regulator HydG